jgi:hypothetical protein
MPIAWLFSMLVRRNFALGSGFRERSYDPSFFESSLLGAASRGLRDRG